MQRYQPPSLEEVRKKIDQLLFDYKIKKQWQGAVLNSTHVESITLIQRLAKQILASDTTPQQKTNCLLGLVLFVLLKNEHKWGRISKYLPEDHGELTKLLKGILGLSKTNTMLQQERLIYLNHFYHFAKNTLQDEWVADLHYKNKTQFLQSVDIKIKQTLELQENYINYVLKEAPDYLSLENNIDTAIKNYEAIFKSRWLNQWSYFKNTKKESDIHFVKLVQTACKAWMDSITNSHAEEKFTAVQKEFIYSVRQGLALSIFMPMYHAHYLSPTGSILNHGSELCLQLSSALNKTYYDFDPAERIRLVKTLLEFIEKANINFSNYPDLNKKAICEHLNHLIAVEEMAKGIPTFKEKSAGIVVGYCAQYGINILLNNLAADIVMPHVGNMIAGSVAGPLGIVSFGVAGLVIESQLGDLIQKKIIDKATAMAYEYVLNAIGAYVGQFAAPNIILTFEISATSLSKLLGFYHDLKKFDQQFAQKVDWIKTLHDLPDHLVNKKTKNILEKTHTTALTSAAPIAQYKMQ